MRVDGRQIAVWYVALSLTPLLLFAFRDLWALHFVLFLGVVTRWREVRDGFRRLTPEVWPLLLLVLWGAVSVLWSPASDAGQHAVEHLLFAALTVWLAIASPRPLSPVFIGAAVAMAAVSAEVMAGQPLRTLLPPEQSAAKDAVAAARGLTLGAALLPGLALYFDRKGARRVGLALIALAAFAAFATPLAALKVAFGFAFLAAFAAFISPRFGVVCIALFVVAIFLSPFLLTMTLPQPEDLRAPSWLGPSSEHRLIIWREVLDAWLAGDPLRGEGVRGSDVLADEAGMVSLSDGSSARAVSIHPHHVVIQVLYEHGLVGFGLLLAGALLNLRKLFRQNLARADAMAVCALSSGALVILSVEADIWNIYTLSALVIGALMIRSGGEAR